MLSSANVLNLDQSKILSFGKELNHIFLTLFLILNDETDSEMTCTNKYLGDIQNSFTSAVSELFYN